jgi:3-deoxy-7-phosphoheptulonate synthase
LVVVLDNNATEEQINDVVKHLEDYGFEIHRSKGIQRTILGAIGVQPNFDTRKIKVLEGVAEVYRVTAPFKLASRSFHPENSVVKIKDVEIGTNSIQLMSGPCSIENEDQIFKLAGVVAKSGSKIIRGGAFKPRTSPYSFQGLGEEGLKLIRKAADEFNLLVITEVMQIGQIDLIYKYADIFQVGARNMQNFSLIKELGNTDKPVMLKRGLSATIEELLMSAEYILSSGNKNVILCERGIRTFEKYTRNTFDVSSIPVVHKKSHLPIIADPSHATGMRDQVPPMARAAVAAGADGLMLEIHDNPEQALSDGPQALLPNTYLSLVEELRVIANAIGRKIN